MKVFWTLMLLVVFGAAVYFVMGRSGTTAVAPPPSAVPVVPPPAPVSKPSDPATPTTNKPATPPAEVKSKPSEPDKAREAFVTPESVAPKPEPAPEKPAVAPEPKVEPKVVKKDEPKPEVKTPEVKPAPAALPSVAPNTTPAPKTTTPAKSDAPTPAPTTAPATPAKVEVKEDGSLLVDEKYVVKGEGSKEKPYEITWEFLVSAQEEYQPRLGKKTLPDRLQLVNGKYVKISGYVAFPVMATEPTEMLSMLNQWDGCCIGVPPTPYDAIEVKLKKAATNEERLTTFGVIEGKLKVEPYLVRDWLVSLYAMDEATMAKSQ